MAKKKSVPVTFDRRHLYEAARWLTAAREKAVEQNGDMLVGLDLSLTSTGMARCSMEDFTKIVLGGWEDPSAIVTGSINNSKSMSVKEKVIRVRDGLVKFMDGCQPYSLAFEAVTVGGPKASLLSFKVLAMCNAVMYTAITPETVVLPVYTLQLKKMAAGNSKKVDPATGKSVAISKQEVIAGLNHHYNGLCDKLKIKTDDEADALCVLLINGYMAFHLAQMQHWLEQPFSDDIVVQHMKRGKTRPLVRERAMASVLDAMLVSQTTWSENETVEHNKILADIKTSIGPSQGVNGRTRNRKASSSQVLQEEESDDEDLGMLSKL